MTAVKPGRAAAAEMSLGTRASQAGVGLCSSCRHPVRLHGDLGCATGECFCSSTGAELRSGVVAEPVPPAPPSAAQLALLDVVCACGHRRTEHSQDRLTVSCDAVCPCRRFTPGDPKEPDAPAAPPAEPTPSPTVAAPAPAVASAAPAGPVGEPPAPVAVVLPPWLPGTGEVQVKGWPPVPVVEVSTSGEDVERQVDDIIAAAKAAARRPRLRAARPAAPTAQVSLAVVGGPDAVEEAAAVPTSAAAADPGDGWFQWGPLPSEVAATPGSLDLTPFLSAALYYYPAWFCKGCLQRRHNPGVHCRRPLVPAYVVIAPREIP